MNPNLDNNDTMIKITCLIFWGFFSVEGGKIRGKVFRSNISAFCGYWALNQRGHRVRKQLFFYVEKHVDNIFGGFFIMSPEYSTFHVWACWDNQWRFKVSLETSRNEKTVTLNTWWHGYKGLRWVEHMCVYLCVSTCLRSPILSWCCEHKWNKSSKYIFINPF